jgi:hypothetical protein
MKAKLIYDLSDEGDKYDYKNALNANEMKHCIGDLYDELRSITKHDSKHFMGEEYKDMLGLVELIKYHIVEFID